LAAQYITAAFVRRQHAIGDQERRRAQMVGNDTVRGLLLAVGIDAGEIGDRLDQRAEQIDLVIVVGALQHRGDTLETHTGVDRRPRQVDTLAAGQLFILHEHQIPDLDETIAVGLRCTRRAAPNVLTVIVKYLRTRPTRAGIAHAPEIIGAGDAHDLLLGQPGDFLPEIEGLVVIDINRDHELIGRHAIFLGHQPPGQLDGALLEIVAERKIAEHLEEGVVACGVADIVEVVVLAAGADAFLRRNRAHIGTLFQAGEDVLELHHAGIGEHQCRVVARHERRRRHDFVPLARKKVEKARPDVVDAAHVPQLSSGTGDSCPGTAQLQCAGKAYMRSLSAALPTET
jgi:hypothetical protein